MYSATLEEAESWIEDFQVRLDSMIREIEAKFPAGCEIYIFDIYDPTDGVGDAPSVFLPDWPDGLAIHARSNEVIRSVTSTTKPTDNQNQSIDNQHITQIISRS